MQYFLSTAETIPEGMGFSLFSPLHLTWLFLFLAAAVLCSLLYRRLTPAGRKRMRLAFAALLVADELFKVAGLLVGGTFLYGYLPLHLCSINIFLIAVHALRPFRLLDNFLYTVCIPAALAALLFPTWTSLPLWNFMHLHSSTVHILLAVYPIMLTAGGHPAPAPGHPPVSRLSGPAGRPHLRCQPPAGHQLHVSHVRPRGQPPALVRADLRLPPHRLPLPHRRRGGPHVPASGDLAPPPPGEGPRLSSRPLLVPGPAAALTKLHF